MGETGNLKKYVKGKEKTIKEVMTYTGELAKFTTLLSFENLPGQVINKVKMCIDHALACSFAGHHLPEPQIAINFLKDLHASGRATSLVDGIKGPPPDVAFVNAVLGHSIIQEDMHLDSGHPGSMVIPVALAMGEETNCTGKEFMVAIAVGYEVMVRVGASMSSLEFFKKYRTSSFFGPYGTCAAAAKLMKLTEEQTVNALGMAGSLSSGLLEFTVEGTGEFLFQNGFAARNGIAAAMLGKAGIQASKAVLEGPLGAWAVYGRREDAEKIIDGLGESFEMLKVYYKPAPACAFVQSSAALALKMAKSQEINLEDIDKIEIRTFQLAKEYPGVDYAGPFTNMSQAKLSQPYTVAAVLAFKDLNQTIYEKVDDPLVNKIAAKCAVVADSELTKNYPQKQGCKINITMGNRKVIRDSQGDVSFMSNDQVVKNFKHQASRLFGVRQAEALMNAISDLDKVEQIGKLTKLCVKK